MKVFGVELMEDTLDVHIGHTHTNTHMQESIQLLPPTQTYLLYKITVFDHILPELI